MHNATTIAQLGLPTEVAVRGGSEAGGDYYANSFEHVLAELERIDLLIQVQVRRARALHKADEQFQGLVISEQEVDDLLARPAGMPKFLAAPAASGSVDVQAAVAGISGQIALRRVMQGRAEIWLVAAEFE